jgi:hypothetical protein
LRVILVPGPSLGTAAIISPFLKNRALAGHTDRLERFMLKLVAMTK